MAIARYLAIALGQGESDTPFECWGREDARGYCHAAWGGWSILMYLPEIALGGAAVAGCATRSLRVLKYGVGLAACCVVVFLFVALGTHLFAINQMPLLWPE